MYSCGPPHMDVQEWDDQHEPTYSNYVRTQDVTLKTCRRRWMIGRNGERGSGISALAARHDDDDDMIYTRGIMTYQNYGKIKQYRTYHWFYEKITTPYIIVSNNSTRNIIEKNLNSSGIKTVTSSSKTI